jgi:PAS domain S-box-containing protein
VRYTGKSEAEQLGFRWLEQLHPEDRQRAIDRWRDTAAKGENFDIEFRIRRHDGAYRWFRTLAVPFRDEAGRVIKWFGSNTDIDDIKRVEEQLRKSEERLKLAQASAGAGIWDWDIPGGTIEWSEELFGLFGLDRREVAASFEAWRTVIHPDDRNLAAERIEGAIRDRTPLDSEYRIRRSSGEIRWIRALGNTKYDRGTPLRMSGICLDITERKRSEELRQALVEQEKLRLGAAVEHASDAIVMIDLDGTIRYVNAAFESTSRIARGAAVGTSYFDLLGGEPAAAAIRKAVASGRPWRGPLTRPVRGGRPVELAVTVSPARDPSGAVIGGLISEKDVTRENALESQVRQGQKMEALGTLAGGIAHDFNNILAAIVINTELALLELDPQDPARQSLPLVLQAANRGKELVKQIITFSRQRTLEKRPIEIAPIVKEGLKLLRTGLAKDIALQETIDAGSGAVLADPSHIHQVLVNLCQNAALAMKDRGGRLEVKLEPVEVDEAMTARYPNLAPGRYVRLTVSDTGCGMTKDDLERIFEPFFTTRAPGEGSGLGLAVVHGIVRTNDGEIMVYSEPGLGSTFNVYLPRLERERPMAVADREADLERGQDRILLVEDEKAQRESVERGLEHLGYRVTARADGRSALTAFKKDPAAFDLVITDQIMPKMTGLELAGAIAALRPDMPIVLCTGFSEKVNEEVVGTLGVRAVLMKPYTIREVSRVIRQALSGDKTPS